MEIFRFALLFYAGMDLSAQRLREKAHAAVMVSRDSIPVPCFSGVTVSLIIYRSLALTHISFIALACAGSHSRRAQSVEIASGERAR